MNHAVIGVIGVFLLGCGAAHAQIWEKKGATQDTEAAALDECTRVASVSTPGTYAPPPVPPKRKKSHAVPIEDSGDAAAASAYQLQDDPYAPDSVSHIERQQLLNLCMEEAGWSRGDSDEDQ